MQPWMRGSQGSGRKRRVAIRLGLASGVLVTLLPIASVAGIVATSSPAGAVEISTPACGSVEFPTGATGSWVIPATGVDVYSNGTSDEGTGYDCSSATSTVNGKVAGEEWQCVEFINRLYLSNGWISSNWAGNAGPEFYDDAPSNLSKQGNGSVSYLGPGDVVVINVYYNGSLDGGHALVVNDASNVANGAVNLVSQNSGYTSNSEPVVAGTLSGGSVSVGGGGDGYTYSTIGVVHAPSGGSSGGGSVQSANLLHDGSAENSSAGWQVGPGTGFARYEGGNGAPAIAHDGSAYLAFNGNASAGASLFQDVPVTAGAWQAYVGTAWVSSQAGTASGQLCLWGLGPNTHSCISYAVAAGTYRKYQVVYDAPQPVSTIRFQFYPGSGTTDVDTMSLVGNLLHDGSAENSSAGWQVGPGTGFARYEGGNGAPAIAHDGSAYLAFNGNASAGASLFQDVPVTAGAWQAYVGTAWVSSQAGTATGQLCLWGLGPNTHSCISYSVSAGTYGEFQVVYDAPQPVSTIRFQLYPGSGTTDVDTMSLG